MIKDAQTIRLIRSIIGPLGHRTGTSGIGRLECGDGVITLITLNNQTSVDDIIIRRI